MRLARSRPRRAPRLEVLIRDGRQLLEEGDDGPDVLVGDADATESGHAGHLDAVLDRPEQLAGRQLGRNLLEVWRAGVQAFGELRPVDAGPAMAADAAILRVSA